MTMTYLALCPLHVEQDLTKAVYMTMTYLALCPLQVEKELTKAVLYDHDLLSAVPLTQVEKEFALADRAQFVHDLVRTVALQVEQELAKAC